MNRPGIAANLTIGGSLSGNKNLAGKLLDEMQSNVKLEAQSVTAKVNPKQSRAGQIWRGLAVAGLAFLGFASSVSGQVTVMTLGGGRASANGSDAGFVDGDSLQTSQFRAPFGAAVDAAGALYIADRDNGALRKLDVAGNRSSTLLTGLKQPVAVATDSTNNIYVLTQGDGQIRRIDRFGNVFTHKAVLLQPTAMALGSSGEFYVTEMGGSLVRVDRATEARVPIGGGLNRPSGVAVLDSRLIAVSDTGNHRLLLLHPENHSIVLQIGTGAPGFRDGSIANALFNQPHHVAKAPNGSLLVADRGNHRVRSIGVDGTVTTLYGIDPSLWKGPECLDCNPIILPGWLDGSAQFAEAREPAGVAVSRDGTVYTTELYYHLIRQITGAGLAAGSGAGGGSGTNLIVLPPVVTPDSGYFPLGQNITVVNPNTNAFFSSALYYTTDGTDPTTNSTRLILSDNRATIQWRETTRDLTALRLVAFMGVNTSEIVSGKPASANEIGVTREISAGAGSTLVIPITVNLRPIDRLKSLQFRVEATQATPSTPPLASRIQPLSVSTNDFIPVVTSSESSGSSSFGASAYTNAQAQGLTITFIGTNANFSVKNFAVVAMLAVPIPATAKVGDRYSIQVLNPSGTSDGAEAGVSLTPMSPRQIVVASTGYRVGDSSPATWYHAGERIGDRVVSANNAYGPYGFGDQRLDNSDVNNAFTASLGVRVPFHFTDLFDAMDAYPEDSVAAVGGDGLVRFLDWQVILRRSLGLDLARWEREWSSNGVRTAWHPQAAAPNLPAETLDQTSSRAVWFSDASLSAVSLENASPGTVVSMPVYVSVASGKRLGGLAFRATLGERREAPPLDRPVEFVAAPGVTAPVQSAGPAANVLLCGWPMVPSPSFEPALEKRTLLGYIRVPLPRTAQAGQYYTLQFANADGSPDLHTQYNFETHSASIWIKSPAQHPTELISDEWRAHFFGNPAEGAAAANADPDEDGVSNLAEYMAGTHPRDARSRLHLETTLPDRAHQGIVLRWLTAPGKTYTIEASSDLLSRNWSVLASGLLGQGGIQEWTHQNPGSGPRYYRLRLETEEATTPDSITPSASPSGYLDITPATDAVHGGLRSAELNSAVSPICNRLGVGFSEDFRPADALQNSILRYGRVQLCATRTADLGFVEALGYTPSAPSFPQNLELSPRLSY